MPWEHATTILGTGSSGFESAPRDLNSHAPLRVHYPVLPPQLPSTTQPIFLPSVSSSSKFVAPLSDQPYLLGASATTPEIPLTERQISHHIEYTTQLVQGHQIQHPSSYGFESALDDLKDHASLQVHHPSLPLERPSTTQPIFIPSVSFSTTATPPSSAQPPFFGGSVALTKIPSADRQVFRPLEYGIQSANGHQIQRPGGPRAYMVDGLLVDEEYLTDEDGGYINVHACGREHSPCGLWVKADRHSILRHGQRWHRDARGGGGDRKITCPWSGCNSQMRMSAIARHTLSAHFGATWTCRGCSKPFTRHDSFKTHSRKCGNLGATVKYDTSTRVIDTQLF
ncbi:hypothetical protein DFJ58DRAFT_53306 [Suillus subalutaceus]|uniref:uncharacterized protein n=1 Tax=Suillus subalutaceus TaxID=48586 RepID=UPI001B884486|nr:uncharacterized protein DFJ58DRAFT_53306 [Suillus subalutaceus]KAG1842645.1 hypothetical protein DFJ58DRAFT_53306 [Suillus subalutaceus]